MILAAGRDPKRILGEMQLPTGLRDVVDSVRVELSDIR